MKTALVVPLATEDPDRLAAWEYLEGRYHREHPDWLVMIGECPPGAWCKAEAVAEAIRHSRADLLIVADADVWCEQTAEFVQKVEAGVWEWASPHRRIVRLNQASTERVYREGFPENMPNPRELTERVYDGMIGGGIVIIPRHLYEQCPLDPRFEGWGGEDESWGRALMTLTKKRAQGRNVLFHLFHRPQTRLNRRVGSPANDALKERYRLAAGDPEATLALIAEGRRHTPAVESVVPASR